MCDKYRQYDERFVVIIGWIDDSTAVQLVNLYDLNKFWFYEALMMTEMILTEIKEELFGEIVSRNNLTGIEIWLEFWNNCIISCEIWYCFRNEDAN